MKALGILLTLGALFAASPAMGHAAPAPLARPAAPKAAHKPALPQPPPPKPAVRPINRSATVAPKAFTHQVPYRRSPMLPAIGGPATASKTHGVNASGVGGANHSGPKPAGTLDGSQVKRKP